MSWRAGLRFDGICGWGKEGTKKKTESHPHVIGLSFIVFSSHIEREGTHSHHPFKRQIASWTSGH